MRWRDSFRNALRLYLRALGKNAYAMLGGGVWVAGIIWAIARWLGASHRLAAAIGVGVVLFEWLEISIVHAIWDAIYEANETPPQLQLPPGAGKRPPARKRTSGRWTPGKNAVAVALSCVLVGGGIAAAVVGGREDGAESTPPPQVEEPVRAVDAAGDTVLLVDGEAVTARPTQKPRPTAKPTPEPEVVDGKVQLTVSVEATCLSNHSLGSDWENEYSVIYGGQTYVIDDGESAFIPYALGDTLTMRSYVMERDDSYSDIEDYSSDASFQESEVCHGAWYAWTHNVVVTEKGGRYAGNTAEWEVVYTFEVK